jgi:glycosyltransferase involved in cell wall biosynthesis
MREKELFLWIDVTDTFLRWNGAPTGIQRTLIGIANAAESNKAVSLCVRDPSMGAWKEIPAAQFIESIGTTVQHLPAWKWGDSISDGLDYLSGLRKSLHNFGSKHFWLFHDWARDLVKVTDRDRLETDAIEEFRKVPVAHFIKRWRSFRKQELSGFAVKHVRQLQIKNLKPIDRWTQKDAVLLVDSNWNDKAILHSLTRAKHRPKVIGFCHDLIPIERPDFVADRAREVFAEWFDLLVAKSDEIICNSEYSAARVRHHLQGRSHQPPVRSTVFGNKLEHPPHPDAGQRSSLASLLRRRGLKPGALDAKLADRDGWILWVGSVDIRKNLDVLLLAAEHLAASGRLNRPIVVAGRPSAGTVYYQWKMRRNPHLRRVIVFVDSPDDDFLSELKRGADLFLYTSWEEGYGLPVAEALQEGIPVIASKATSIPEVGGELVEYFEPWNSGELAQLLLRFEQDEDFRRGLESRAKRFVPTTWGQMIDDILEKSVLGQS